jgi:hypothetical protein
MRPTPVSSGGTKTYHLVGISIMEKVKFIKHKGKDILHIDFTNAEPDEVMTICEDAKAMVSKQTGSALLTMTDVSEAKVTPEVSQALKDLASHNKPYAKAGAVLGVTGLKKVIFNSLLIFTGRRNLHLFDSPEQARNWLAEQ